MLQRLKTCARVRELLSDRPQIERTAYSNAEHRWDRLSFASVCEIKRNMLNSIPTESTLRIERNAIGSDGSMLPEHTRGKVHRTSSLSRSARLLRFNYPVFDRHRASDPRKIDSSKEDRLNIIARAEPQTAVPIYAAADLIGHSVRESTLMTRVYCCLTTTARILNINP